MFSFINACIEDHNRGLAEQKIREIAKKQYLQSTTKRSILLKPMNGQSKYSMR